MKSNLKKFFKKATDLDPNQAPFIYNTGDTGFTDTSAFDPTYVKSVNQSFNNTEWSPTSPPIKDFFKNIWSKMKPTVQGIGGYVKANPWQSAGLAGTGLANLAGLFDNDKIGGQLAGAAGGGLIGHYLLPKLLGSAISPQAQILTALGGGTLGALFDSLRQRQEDEYNIDLMAMQNMNRRY